MPALEAVSGPPSPIVVTSSLRLVPHLEQSRNNHIHFFFLAPLNIPHQLAQRCSHKLDRRRKYSLQSSVPIASSPPTLALSTTSSNPAVRLELFANSSECSASILDPSRRPHRLRSKKDSNNNHSNPQDPRHGICPLGLRALVATRIRRASRRFTACLRTSWRLRCVKNMQMRYCTARKC